MRSTLIHSNLLSDGTIRYRVPFIADYTMVCYKQMASVRR
jgi:hypothetical protein